MGKNEKALKKEEGRERERERESATARMKIVDFRTRVFQAHEQRKREKFVLMVLEILHVLGGRSPATMLAAANDALATSHE